MAKLQNEESHLSNIGGNEDNENVTPKAIYVALRNLVYFDQLFREDLTGNNSGNNRTHLSKRVEADNAKFGTKFPTEKQLIHVKKMFISLGAVFREKGNDERGEGSCYEYADRSASLLWLSDIIGEIREDLKKNDIDIDNYFINTIGVANTGNIQETILRFDKDRYKYLVTKKLLPCHLEIKSGEEFYDEERPTIKMQVIQNHELVQKILSFGADVEVIKPDTLREKVKSIVSKMFSHYDH